jgi:carbon monoxide dehydrogenase subunit G
VAIPIEERFEVAAPIEQVWAYFQDPPQVVPCIPGAELVGSAEENTYEGKVSFQVAMSLIARGMQQGAPGRAEAQVQFELQPLGDTSTEVSIKADISIAGKLAQLGGGMIQSVSRQIFRKFADCARQEILGSKPG